VAGGGFSLGGRIFGGAATPDGGTNTLTGAPVTDASDHLTLLALVLIEALFVGWLRFSFKAHFGG